MYLINVNVPIYAEIGMKNLNEVLYCDFPFR